MSDKAKSTFLPASLSAIPDRWSAWVRPLWLLGFAFAVLADVAGAGYVLHDTYETNPVFETIGLSDQIEYDGSVTLGAPVGDESARQGIREGSRILAVEGRPIAAGTRVDALADIIRAAPGPIVRVRIQAPDGRVADHPLTRSPVHVRQEAARQSIPRDTRMAIRFLFSALGCVTLLACAVMLFIRRPRDPVAMLMSFAFLGMAATIDPPLLMWMALGLTALSDVLSSAWWYLLVVALAAFPDGRFMPGWLRWIPLVALPLAVLVSLPGVNEGLQIVAGLLIPLALLLAMPLRYRRLEPGIERQQIKWAAFGFAAGLVLIGVAMILVALLPPDSSPARAALNLVTVCVFSLGFALMPLGVMISLIRFRLWEADTVISRSAAYAIVTVIVGIVWAASTDLVKELVARMMGEENATVATTMSAMLAAGVFAPTQNVVLGWTRRHFGKDADKLRGLAARLAVWRNTETAAEMGMRALAIVAESVHADSAAILALTPTGRDLVAARDVEDPEKLAEPGALDEDDPRFPLSLPLEDVDGPVGVLLIGPRSDGNRYNKDEREVLSIITEPLAEAIRFANLRAAREDGMQKMIISAVEERLAQLRIDPSPKPA
jgi:hypothetical protein